MLLQAFSARFPCSVAVAGVDGDMETGKVVDFFSLIIGSFLRMYPLAQKFYI